VDHYLNGGKDRIFGSFNRTNVDKVLSAARRLSRFQHTSRRPTRALQLELDARAVGEPAQQNVVLLVRVYGTSRSTARTIPGIQ